MFPIVRSALVVAAIFALSPVRDGGDGRAAPAAPPSPNLREAARSATDAAAIWSALPEETRARLAQELARAVADGALRGTETSGRQQ